MAAAMDEQQSADAIPIAPPLKLFAEWFATAKESELNDPDAVALATATPAAAPSVRMVLLKEAVLVRKRRRQRLRLFCGGKVEASCCHPAALLRHPKGGHVPPQLPQPPPLPMQLWVLFLALVR